MGFMVKRNTNFKEPMKEVEYLNEIGVKYISGRKLGNMISQVIVDEPENAYLVGTGVTNPNRDGGDYPIHFYSFCKDGFEYKLQVRQIEKGNPYDQNIEIGWDIKIIYIPEGVDWDKYKKEICEMIEETFRIKAYSSYGKSTVCTNIA